MAAGRVVPELAVDAHGVVAQVDVVHPGLKSRVIAGGGNAAVGALHGGVAVIGELLVAALAAIGTFDSHCRDAFSAGWAGRPRPFRRSACRWRSDRGDRPWRRDG